MEFSIVKIFYMGLTFRDTNWVLVRGTLIYS